MRVAEQPGRRMAPHFLRFCLVGIGALAGRKEAALAKEALSTGDGEGDDYPVADFELLVLPPYLHNFAHRFMTHDIAAIHFGDDTVEEMKIGAANGAGGYLDDGVARCFNLGIGNGVAANVRLAVPAERPH
jgi:hypothetical protein